MDYRRFNHPCNMGKAPNTGMPLNNMQTVCPQAREYPSLAIVYSPYQSFTGLFDPMTALCKGTLFSELDKPFYGTCDGNSIRRGNC